MIIKSFLAFVSILTFVYLFTQGKQQNTFQKWMSEHKKQYFSELQIKYRESVFQQNEERIKRHNQDNSQTYQLGLTKFADLKQEEFKLLYLGAKNSQRVSVLDTELASDNIRGLNLDWDISGKVSPVKFQGMCASCWAFSAVGALESQSLINNRSDLFSQQQLVDCSSKYGNDACHDGWMPFAFQYIKEQGIQHQSDYPYVAKTQKCHKKGGSYRISNYTQIQGCDNMLNALSQKPVSVAVDATYWALYKSGIFSNCSTEINHGVLLVGVTDDYWRIKNSWDTAWGQNGFIRLARGNTCDVCHYPSYPNDLYIK